MTLIGEIRSLVTRVLRPSSHRLANIERRLEEIQAALTPLSRIQEALGRIESRQTGNTSKSGFADHEYRVFSQWGEDGIIQFLLRHIDIDKKIFVEFGVEDYSEANTRFLLVNNNWRGLVIDSNRASIERIKKSTICWGYGLQAVHALITVDNINQLLEDNDITGEIGLLSIDIDGNDYWVWRAIEVINPVIAIIEYNHRFGSDAALTIPYDESFERGQEYPLYYFGASLKALCALGERKGYAFVGCNSNGVNAFFVRRDKLPEQIKELSPAEGFVAGKFNETQDEEGRYLNAAPDTERLMLMSLPLVNLEKEEGIEGPKTDYERSR